MKVLVTGATGFIGSHVADMLLDKGYEVVCTVRKSSNLRWLKDKNFIIEQLPAIDDNHAEKIFSNLDAVYHIAGATFARDYDEFYKSNALATKDLIEQVIKYSPNLKRFVYMSSFTVSGPALSLDCPVDEISIPKPLTAYAKSKHAGEELVLSYKDKIPVTIIKAPAVFGPRDTAIYSIFKTANMGLGTLIGLNKKYLNLIYGLDLARGTILAGESEKAIGQSYFLADNQIYNWDELIKIIKDALGKKFFFNIRIPDSIVMVMGSTTEWFGQFLKKAPIFNRDKAVDFTQEFWICSANKAQTELGFKCEYTVPEAIQETVNWYKQNKWL
ncbi:MAG: NAD(P)-dependent oxidoreductase [Ignavibacteriae bacterium HGW-Ignavibacteriae-1]|jgi:nucleoside-diphosphate-sugar epimerase|nr:MAG: NAD(P)-dependent oxidoreductase [Ignavibacteriae bacterium HGW-Ignavibacteriae-1]